MEQTNIKKIQNDIDELEKRLKSLANKLQNIDFSQVTSQIEQVNTSLQNYISSNDPRVTTIEQNISNLSEQITSINTILDTLETSQTSQDSQISTINTNIDFIVQICNNLADTILVHNRDIATLKSQMTTAQTNLTTLNTNVSSLTTRMTTAENNISALSGGTITPSGEIVEKIYQVIDYIYDSVNQQLNSLNFYSKLYYFLNPHKGKLHFTIYLEFNSSYTGTMKILVNQNGYTSLKVENIDLSKISYNHTFSFDCEAKDLNSIFLKFETTANVFLSSIKITIFGKNVNSAGGFTNFENHIFDNTNYWFFKTYPNIYLCQATTYPFNNPTIYPYLDITSTIYNKFCYLPKLYFDSNRLIQKSNNYLICDSYHMVTCLELDSNNTIVETKTHTHNFNCINYDISGDSENCDVMCYALNNSDYICVGTLSTLLTTGNLPRVTINNSSLYDKFCYIYPIQNYDFATNDTESKNLGFLATKDDGYVYYFDGKNSNCKIQICRGFRPHGFLRNNSIIIYVNDDANNFKKLKLVYDESTHIGTVTTLQESVPYLYGYEIIETKPSYLMYKTDLGNGSCNFNTAID